MRKKNIYKDNDYDDSYSYNNNSYINRIEVNKKSNISNKNVTMLKSNKINNKKNNIYKDNLYYENKNKNKNKRNKFSEEKATSTNTYYNNREPYKKTINTYSNENKIKDRNIFEELQNNKYLRPMLGTNNINTKLLKCKIEEPIKNISTLSLRNYFSNMELPFKKNKSPQKRNINYMYDEDNIYSINLNNRTVMDRFNININNDYSPIKDNLENITYQPNNNSNSFIYKGNSVNYNNDLLRYSANNINKFYSNQLGKLKNEKYFYYEKKKEKSFNYNNNDSPKIYHKNIITVRGPFNEYKKDIYNNNFNYNINLKNINNINNQKDKILLNIYKNKLVEEFIIVLNKFISKYFNKIGHLFLNKLINFKSSKSKKTKIYFRKKNSRINIQKLTLNGTNNDIKLLINLQKNNKSKMTTDITNFNSKSFSNEFKSSSLTSNFRINNILKKHNDSFIKSEQKQKIYYQSPEDSLYKYKQKNIRKKIIVHPKKGSGSKNKISTRSPDKYEMNDIFVYKKKNMNNDNLYINKNYKISNLSYLNLNKNKTNNIITNNKKGKIIDIDINLGKPVSIINDHSPLEELFIENINNKNIFKLNTISSKFNNNNNQKKKNKAKSGSKNKIKPPLRKKRFVEEEDDELDNNEYLDNKDNKDNNDNSSMKKEKNNFRKYFGLENNNTNNNKNAKEIKEQKIEKNMKQRLFIRFNHFSIYNNSYNIKKGKNRKYKYLIKSNNNSIFLKNNKNDKNDNKEIKNSASTPIKNIKNKSNNLYINCTKFLEKIFNKIIKKKIFVSIYQYSKI